MLDIFTFDTVSPLSSTPPILTASITAASTINQLAASRDDDDDDGDFYISISNNKVVGFDSSGVPLVASPFTATGAVNFIAANTVVAILSGQ